MKTLQEALTLVPTYWPLVPGVDKWKEGDEFYDGKIGIMSVWKKQTEWFGETIITPDACRRPIPQSVREAEAFWVLARKLLGMHAHVWLYNKNYRTSSKPDAVELLGGPHQIELMLTEGPGALWRWVEENRK